MQIDNADFPIFFFHTQESGNPRNSQNQMRLLQLLFYSRGCVEQVYF
jgi:hypothetical protein